jgi:hypothetical protein
MNDWDINLAIASRVSRIAPELAGTVAVHAQLGTVQIKGWVPTVEAKHAVVRAVASLGGVLGVEDELEVRTAAPVTPEPAPEEASPEQEPTSADPGESTEPPP